MKEISYKYQLSGEQHENESNRDNNLKTGLFGYTTWFKLFLSDTKL